MKKEDGMKKIINEEIKQEEVVSDWRKVSNKKYKKKEEDIEIAFEGGFSTNNKNKRDKGDEGVSAKKEKKSMKERRRAN